ncbi:MAG TPA: DNA polymerase [Pyrinomonadaceae bacterium]|jgi:DNA polymerase-1|nr:DNA polymerase [Pyrinomonadaceae bacterium]
MEIYFQLVNDADGLKKAVEELKNEPFLGFDVETTELDPYKGDLRLVQLSNGRNTKVIDLKPFAERGDLATSEELAPLRDLLASKKQLKIAHNAKFDTKWVRHHLGTEVGAVYDTYLASLLVAAGEGERRHGLADVAQFFLQQTLDKTEQVSDWGANELSHSQIEYAARDAAIMPDVREKLDERIQLDGLKNVLQLENECVMPIAEMELNGFYLDETRWRTQLDSVNKTQARTANELQDLLAAGIAQASLFGRPEINLDSIDQVTGALLGLGVPVPNTTRAWELQPLAEQYPVVGKLLEYRAAAKASSSFGENILGFIEPKTGRIHADFRQIGAPTGRFSCSSPNLQQIPHESEYRSCFRAPDGRKLVIADYSQIELRILADFSEDENFINAFVSGQDFHSTTAAQIFGTKPENVDADQRSFAKRLNFGVVYGIGAQRFAMMTGLTERQAEDTLRRYFATYPKMDEWLRMQSKGVLTERAARTASGRLARINFDANDRSSIGAAQRYAKNMPIQGTSADILKRALRLLHDDLRDTTAKLVNIVHDEIVVECDAADASEIAAKIESAMLRAGEQFVKRVPIKVDVTTSDEWCK